MKMLALVLAFSGVLGYSQSSPKGAPDPNQLFRLPSQLAFSQRDLAKAPSFTAPLPVWPVPHIVLRTSPPKPLSNPHLDEKIIRHPPPEAFVQQPPRSPLVKNLYPDLKLLPVEIAKLDAAPGQEAKLKAEKGSTPAPRATANPASPGLNRK